MQKKFLNPYQKKNSNKLEYEQFYGTQNHCDCCDNVIEGNYMDVFGERGRSFVHNYIENREYHQTQKMIILCTNCVIYRINRNYRPSITVPVHIPEEQRTRFVLRSLLKDDNTNRDNTNV